jgi:hypothetical protein
MIIENMSEETYHHPESYPQLSSYVNPTKQKQTSSGKKVRKTKILSSKSLSQKQVISYSRSYFQIIEHMFFHTSPSPELKHTCCVHKIKFNLNEIAMIQRKVLP